MRRPTVGTDAIRGPDANPTQASPRFPNAPRRLTPRPPRNVLQHMNLGLTERAFGEDRRLQGHGAVHRDGKRCLLGGCSRGIRPVPCKCADDPKPDIAEPRWVTSRSGRALARAAAFCKATRVSPPAPCGCSVTLSPSDTRGQRPTGRGRSARRGAGGRWPGAMAPDRDAGMVCRAAPAMAGAMVGFWWAVSGHVAGQQLAAGPRFHLEPADLAHEVGEFCRPVGAGVEVGDGLGDVLADLTQ
jgi:hypothetical protein